MASASDTTANGVRPAQTLLRTGAAGDIPDGLRIALVGATLLAFWNHTPLSDLSDPALLETQQGGAFTTQALFISLAVAMILALRQVGFDRLRPLLTWPLITCAGWLVVTMLTSAEPLVSMRRMILFAIAVLLAAGIPVVMRTVRQFAVTLAGCAILILVTSYLSVALLPHLAIHNVYDLINEPEHIGKWRGIFAHKNEAGGAMALMILTGLFVAGACNRFLGFSIVVAACFFMAMTESKTVIIFMPFVIFAPSLCRVFRGLWTRAAMMLGPVLLVSLFSLGTVFFPPIRDGLAGYVPDLSFTGRTEIWEFAADHIAERPVFGWGIGAFWGTERTRFGTADAMSWVTKTSQAHNTYIDTALVMGLPGLIITLIVFVIAPLRDFQKIAPGGRIDPTTLYFMRLWLLALAGGSFETVLYSANVAICCMFMLAVFGLRQRASFPTVPA